jgi:hypothetical protein
MYTKNILQKNDPFNKKDERDYVNKTIFYGEVVSIDDPTSAGRVKVKVLELDNKIANRDLPFCDSIFPKFFHIIPKLGEIVRVFIMDTKYPYRNRLWMGSVISQLQKIEFDSAQSAYSTTDMALIQPLQSYKLNPNTAGVFPDDDDVGLIGRVNTDVILKKNQVIIRAGKHLNGDINTLNKTNSASLIMSFDPKSTSSTEYYSNSILFSNKIALLTHNGNPNFKSTNLTTTDKDNIFNNAHPMGRGDIMVVALELIRKAIVSHKHPYSNTAAMLETVITDLEKFDFTNILQPNIVIN